jgi:Leukotriene A4 hydrolase, C-terminal.
MANQIVVFLDEILQFEKPLSPGQSRRMGETYGFAKSENIEVTNLYFQVGLNAGDESVIEPTRSLLGRIGRMKFVRPLYVTSADLNISPTLAYMSSIFPLTKFSGTEICRSLTATLLSRLSKKTRTSTIQFVVGWWRKISLGRKAIRMIALLRNFGQITTRIKVASNIEIKYSNRLEPPFSHFLGNSFLNHVRK